ncbi:MULTISPECIES: hypothetical protein [Lactobacillus]|uniref:hypothetical protein n=1 Tax=Lactobacillus TaxID=1578 RepID=UPI001F224AC9|nr:MULTISPECIES: hypothetical protein [Lactobacillus]
MNEYLLTSTKAAHLKSLALFLSGLGLVLFISIYAWYEPFHGPFFSSVAITLLFITWAIAAGCLIYGFLLTRDFRQIKRKQFTLTNEQLLQIKNKQKDFQHQNNKRIITAVILCILTVIPPSIAVAWRAPSFIKWESLALSLLLFSIAIYQFIFYKLQNLIYIILTQQQKLLSKKDRQLLTNITIIYWFIILVYWFIMETYLYALPWSSELNFTTIFFGFIIYLIFTWFFFQKRAQK